VLLPAKFTFGAVWSARSSLPFSALAGTDADSIRQYVTGTSRNQGNRDLSLDAVNAYRATLGLAPVTAASFNSSKFNSFDVRLTRPIFVKDQRRLELGLQVFNLFNHENFGVPSGQMTAGGNTNIASSAIFGQIAGALAMRQAELSARFAF